MATLFVPGATLFAQGTAFTYQGRLNDGTNRANGSYDMRFKLFVDPLGNTQAGSAVLTNGVPVINGIFTVALDFGAGIFNGTSYWLGVEVRTNGAGAYVELSSFEALAPVVQAVFAQKAANSALAAGTYTNVLTLNDAANQFTGTFMGTAANVTNVNAPTLDGLSSGGFWQPSGNGGTTPGVNFVGTTDNQPLELRVNSQRALRLEPSSAANAAPNVIGGSPNNSVNAGVSGATIGGGGSTNYTGNAEGNSVSGNYGTVSGGFGNSAAREATVGGGSTNGATSSNATIRGGTFNAASGAASTIGGGRFNVMVNAAYATVVGGYFNQAYLADRATIGGGFGAYARGTAPTVSGGSVNQALGDYSTVGGGAINVASNTYTTVRGGYGNSAMLINATVGGGYQNSAGGGSATVGGGTNNQALGLGAVVSGGIRNNAAGPGGVIGGGQINFAGTNATVAGGANNTATGGVALNGAPTGVAMVGGGVGNGAMPFAAVVAGGKNNTANTPEATVTGGQNNTASGEDSTIPGGTGNTTANGFSFAAGSGAQALNTSSFAWSDGTSSSSPAFGQFAVTAAGGVLLAADVQLSALVAPFYHNLSLSGGNALGYLYGSYPAYHDEVALGYNYYADPGGNPHVSNTGGGTSRVAVGYGYIALLVGGVNTRPSTLRLKATSTGVSVYGTFNNQSDRNAKQDFARVSSLELLERVARLPISEWSYKEDPTTRHIGPVAQDFYSIFTIGTDDRHIAPIDEGGVALAAIEGFNEKLENRIRKLQVENADLKARLKKLEQTLLDGKRN